MPPTIPGLSIAKTRVMDGINFGQSLEAFPSSGSDRIICPTRRDLPVYYWFLPECMNHSEAELGNVSPDYSNKKIAQSRPKSFQCPGYLTGIDLSCLTL